MTPEQRDQSSKDTLDDSWFQWQKPVTSRPPPRPASQRPPISDEESIDEVADDWFR